VRPGVEALEKLKGRFSLALWTSAMQQNLAKMKLKVEETANLTFDRTLHRGHCITAPPEVLLKRKHETCKPLAKFFGDGPGPGIGRVILVDDNPDKSLPDEAVNMLLVPAWVEGAPIDRVVEVLVEGLLAMDDTQPDIRAQIAVVQKRVWDYWDALKLEPLTSSPESSTSDSSPNPERAAQAAVAMALIAKLSQDGDSEIQAMTREERRKQKKLLKKEQGHKKKSKKDRKRAKLEQQDGTCNASGNDADATTTTITPTTTMMTGSAQDAEEVSNMF
jgi:hypothetical protein